LHLDDSLVERTVVLIMSKKKNAAKDNALFTEYFSDFSDWPSKWVEGDEDLKIGEGMLDSFAVFIKSLIAGGLAKKTIKNHMSNLDLLGNEIIRRLNDGDAAYRKLATNVLILKYIDDETGPLLPFWDPNDSTELAHHIAFDATCRKLYKFISPPF
jgi:hypothetical protein